MHELLIRRPARSHLSQEDYVTFRFPMESSTALSPPIIWHSPSTCAYEGPQEEEDLGVVPEQVRSDLGVLIKRAEQLLSLPAGWDSYGARRVAPDAALHALEVYVLLAMQGLPRPQLVPTVRGGVQLEWSVGDVDLEVEVLERGHLEFLFEDETSPETAEDSLLSISEYGRLVALARRLVSRPEATA